jgi:hypothetical protein
MGLIEPDFDSAARPGAEVKPEGPSKPPPTPEEFLALSKAEQAVQDAAMVLDNAKRAYEKAQTEHQAIHARVNPPNTPQKNQETIMRYLRSTAPGLSALEKAAARNTNPASQNRPRLPRQE